VIDFDKIDWPIKADKLAELFGVKYHYIRNIPPSAGPKRGVHFTPGVDYIPGKRGPGGMSSFYFAGAIKVAKIIKTQQGNNFLKHYGEDYDCYKPEDFILNTLINAINGHTEYLRSFTLDKYRIDLYLPKLGIVVEVDELDHASYDKYKEIKREKLY
jgi:hypothetical protein